MPPKVDIKTLIGKMENAARILYKLIEEFEIIFSVKPELQTLESAFHQVETRYRLIKKQQETIMDRLVDDSSDTDEGLLLTTRKLGDKIRADFLQTALKFATYQKEQNSSEKSFTHFATTLARYVNDMGDNGCPVLESSEAPFLMSQLLSKLDPKDNSDFGREMKREGKEETFYHFD